VTGLKLPPPSDDITDARTKLEERASELRSVIETLDLVYDAFGQKRFGAEWQALLPKMQRWLAREERRAA
jgi:hypothetical protein